MLRAFEAGSGSENGLRVKSDPLNVAGITAIAVSGGTAYAGGDFGGRTFVNPRTIGSIDMAAGTVD